MYTKFNQENSYYIPLEGTPYKIWTLQEGNGENKLLVINGGPGFTHDYLQPFAEYLPERNFTIYFYDQLGTGNSHPELADETLWTVERYVGELEQVCKGLGLENFMICGHSWGGVLAIEYALKYPQNLTGLIISNMVASMQSYISSHSRLREYLTPEKLKILEQCEREENFDSEQYQQIIMEIGTKYVCLNPLPEYAIKSFMSMNKSVYHTMWGKNEFFPTGKLKDWNRWDELDKINVPTLLIVGRHDTMDVNDVEEMFKRISGSSLTICENSAHLSMIDDADTYFQAIEVFSMQCQRKREAKTIDDSAILPGVSHLMQQLGKFAKKPESITDEELSNTLAPEIGK